MRCSALRSMGLGTSRDTLAHLTDISSPCPGATCQLGGRSDQPLKSPPAVPAGEGPIGASPAPGPGASGYGAAHPAFPDAWHPDRVIYLRGPRGPSAVLFLTVAILLVGCSGDDGQRASGKCPDPKTSLATVTGVATDGLGKPDALRLEVTIGADGVAFLYDERGDCYESEPTGHPAGSFRVDGQRGSGVGIIATMPDGSALGFNKVQNE